MNVEEQYGDRVAERDVAKILHAIGTTTNRLDKPGPGDIGGIYDFWFDGGAGRIITGWTEYCFIDGTRAIVGTNPLLSISICFPDGRKVEIGQQIRPKKF